MKKVKLIFSFMLFFLCITMVKAEDIFTKNWEQANNQLTQSNATVLLMMENVETYKEGFLKSEIESVDSTENIIVSKLTYYDLKGNVVKSTTYENNTIINMSIQDDSIYALTLKTKIENDETISEMYLQKINSELKIEKEVYIGVDDDSNTLLITMISKILGIQTFNISTDEICLYNQKYIECYNTNFEQTSKIGSDEENFDQVFEEKMPELFSFFSTVNSSNEISLGTDSLGNKKIASSVIQKENTETGGTTTQASLVLYEDNTIVFDKTYDEYAMILRAKLIDNYIVATAASMDETTDSSMPIFELIVIDYEGNIIQKIENNDALFTTDIAINGKSFMTSILYQSTEGSCASNLLMGTTSQNCYYSKSYMTQLDFEAMGKNTRQNCYYSKSLIFSTPGKIDTNIIGKGTINVNKTDSAGNKVVFQITPEEGYVLSVVKVTDSNGNVITFTDYTFTMPNADVTIEAIFVLDNPKTSDIFAIVCTIFVISGILLTYLNQKRIKLN